MTHTPGTYVGLLDPEDESATMDCSCTLRRSINRRDIVKLYHCPVHAAAPSMLEALRETTETLDCLLAMSDGEMRRALQLQTGREGHNDLDQARKVLAKIDSPTQEVAP